MIFVKNTVCTFENRHVPKKTKDVPSQCHHVNALSNNHTDKRMEKSFLKVSTKVMVKLVKWLDNLKIDLAQKYCEAMFPRRNKINFGTLKRFPKKIGCDDEAIWKCLDISLESNKNPGSGRKCWNVYSNVKLVFKTC